MASTPDEYVAEQLALFPRTLQEVHLTFDVFVNGPKEELHMGVLLQDHPTGEWIACTTSLIHAPFTNQIALVDAMLNAIARATSVVCPF